MSLDSLNRSGVQSSNPSLFDTVKELIDKVTKLDKSQSSAGVVFDPNLLGSLGSFLQSTGSDLIWQPEFTTIVRKDVGTLNNYNPNVTSNAFITFQNPALLIINGFFVGYPGQILVLKAGLGIPVGFGNFTGGAKDTKLINLVAGNTIISGGGYAIYQYTANPIFGGGENAWVLIGHNQGQAIAIVPTLDGTGGMTWTAGLTNMVFALDGTRLSLDFYGLTGVLGGIASPEARFTMPYTAAAYQANQLGPILCNNGAGNVWTFAQTTGGDNHVSIFQNNAAPWALGNLTVFGQLKYLVQ